MTRENYDIVGSYNNQRVSEIDAERTVNLFEYIDPNGKRPRSLLPTPGLLDSGIVFIGAAGGFRQSFVFNDFQYHVIGQNVYRVDNLFSASNIFSVLTIAGYVGIDANTYQIIFVDGQNGYIWDTTAGTVFPIIDPGFPATPIDVCYLDGFFVVANGNTNAFQLSEFNNGLLWSNITQSFTIGAGPTTDITVPANTNLQTTVPVTVSGGSLPAELTAGVVYYVIRINSTTLRLATTYANAVAGVAISYVVGTASGVITNDAQLQQGAITSHPGTIVACRTLHRRLFLFSQNYTEVWENAGAGTNLPFRRNNSLLIELGTPSIGSIATGFDRLFFLSQDTGGLSSVQMISGTEPISVSSRALDYEFATFDSDPLIGVEDAFSEIIKTKGIIFYRINFTNANKTFVYNVSMSTLQDQNWHEEEMLNHDRHVAQTQIFYNGKNYYGSYKSPTLYIVDDIYPTNDGEVIRRMRIGRPIGNNTMNRTRIDRFQLDLLQGDASLLNLSTTSVNIQTEDNFTLITEDNFALINETEITQQNTIDDPKVYLAISKDGGVSYGNELIAPMGKIGERSFRTVWRKLGTIPRGQIFVPRIQFFDPIPIVILGACWDFEVMPE